MKLTALSFKNRTSSKGFTLVELLIVIAIIGILAGALFVLIDPAKRINDSRDAKAHNDIDQITGAFGAWNADNATTNNGNTSPFPVTIATMIPGTLKSAPTQYDGTAYNYTISPAGCLGTAASPCTAVSVWGRLADQAAYNAAAPQGCGVGVTCVAWCWRSATNIMVPVSGYNGTVAVPAGCLP